MTSAGTMPARSTAFGRWWDGLSAERALWWLAVALGGSIVWWAPHPPMTDLPQHAGQVRLLHDMVLGESPWASRLRINLLTPYLIGYGLALPLSFLMPVTAALKVLLTAAYLCFVAIGVRLGRHWGSDPRLDWLYLPGFFGFAFSWGFFTFLVASPIGLLFLWVAERHALRQTLQSALAVAGLGVVLLASHGLVFVFCAGLGAAIVALTTPGRSWARCSLPFVVLLGLLCVYLVAARHNEAGMQWTPVNTVDWDLHWRRIPRAVTYAIVESPAHRAMVAASVALILLPFVIGSRLRASRRVPILVFGAVMAVLLLAPTFAARTGYIDERFALFFFPAYAWLFESPRASRRSTALARFGSVTLPLCVGFALAWHVVKFRGFAEETAAIDAQMAKLVPGQRVFSLIFDHESVAGGVWAAYNHYPAWYQAEYGGFAEFNFAWFPPQVVRFRPETTSHVKPDFDWFPQRFAWKDDAADDATYFFVRHRAPIPDTLFDGAPCPPVIDWQQGEWTIYKRVPTCS